MWSWIIIILVIVGFLIAWRIIKSILKAFFVISMILLLVTLIAGVFLYNSVDTFKEKFPTAKKLFIYEEDGLIISAIEVADLTFREKAPTGYSTEELASLNAAYTGNPKTLLSDNYIVIIITPRFFSTGLPADLDLVEVGNITKEEFMAVLHSERPTDIYLRNIPDLQKENIRAMILQESSEEDIRARYVLYGFSAVLNDKGWMFALDQMKSDQLTFYPDYFIFSFLQNTPDFIIKRFID